MSLQHIILGLLKFNSMSGYDLKQLIDQSTAHFWYSDLSQIYRALDANHVAGWVSVKDDAESSRQRKVYSITDDGETALMDWLTSDFELNRARRPELAKLFFGRFVPTDTVRRQVKKRLQVLQGYLATYQMLHEQISSFEDEHPIDVLYWLITIDNGVRVTTAQIEWCDATLQQLDKIERMQP